LGESRIIYKKLKGIRSRIKRSVEAVEKASAVKPVEEMGVFEEQIRSLTKNKTRLRKRFEKLTRRRGPYS